MEKELAIISIRANTANDGVIARNNLPNPKSRTSLRNGLIETIIFEEGYLTTVCTPPKGHTDIYFYQTAGELSGQKVEFRAIIKRGTITRLDSLDFWYLSNKKELDYK